MCVTPWTFVVAITKESWRPSCKCVAVRYFNPLDYNQFLRTIRNLETGTLNCYGARTATTVYLSKLKMPPNIANTNKEIFNANKLRRHAWTGGARSFQPFDLRYPVFQPIFYVLRKGAASSYRACAVSVAPPAGQPGRRPTPPGSGPGSRARLSRPPRRAGLDAESLLSLELLARAPDLGLRPVKLFPFALPAFCSSSSPSSSSRSRSAASARAARPPEAALRRHRACPSPPRSRCIPPCNARSSPPSPVQPQTASSRPRRRVPSLVQGTCGLTQAPWSWSPAPFEDSHWSWILLPEARGSSLEPQKKTSLSVSSS